MCCSLLKESIAPASFSSSIRDERASEVVCCKKLRNLELFTTPYCKRVRRQACENTCYFRFNDVV